MSRQPAVYIMASNRNGTLYISVARHLAKRVWEHKNDLVEGFTKRHGVHKLAYYETCDDMTSGVTREKQLEKWHTQWKVQLIEAINPEWADLYNEAL